MNFFGEILKIIIIMAGYNSEYSHFSYDNLIINQEKKNFEFIIYIFWVHVETDPKSYNRLIFMDLGASILYDNSV